MNALGSYMQFPSVINLPDEKQKDSIPGTSTTLVGGFEEIFLICKLKNYQLTYLMILHEKERKNKNKLLFW